MKLLGDLCLADWRKQPVDVKAWQKVISRLYNQSDDCLAKWAEGKFADAKQREKNAEMEAGDE